MPKGKILIVLTSHGQLGQTGRQTGFHYEELATPYQRFKQAGYDITLASIKGGQPPYDPKSLKDPIKKNPASVVYFLADKQARQDIKQTIPISACKAEDFEAIYLPGGHGTMWDFPQCATLGKLVGDFYRSGKPVAAICHGISGLISAEDKMSQPLVKGRRINCFTNEEEKAVGLEKVVPFLLETAMRELGAKFECSPPFEVHVAQDDHLITGQNPASADALAEAVLVRLEVTRHEEAA
jgi:putative intracellular protease/amidase